MENTQLDPQELKIQGLIDRYLNHRDAALGPDALERHIDQDSLAAFTEGSISEREAAPLVRHLVDCSFCRHITAELVRLDLAFAESPVPESVPSAEPTKVSEVLSGLFSKIFGTTDGAVFAHNETEGSEEDKDEEAKDKETD
jgi:hypothetical protein